jgi:hypothetical protein
MIMLGAILCETFPGICELYYEWLQCEQDPDECAAKFEQMQTAVIQFCEEYPDACTAMFAQMQTQAIQYCEQYPDECQEAFEAWVESLDEDMEE